jgi:hypothetical protein
MIMFDIALLTNFHSLAGTGHPERPAAGLVRLLAALALVAATVFSLEMAAGKSQAAAFPMANLAAVAMTK